MRRSVRCSWGILILFMLVDFITLLFYIYKNIGGDDVEPAKGPRRNKIAIWIVDQRDNGH